MHHRVDGFARRQLVPRLRRYLDEHPADLAISVFSTGASAISSLAPRYPAMSHVVFCTDVTPHRLWVHPNVDLYLVTSRVAEAAVRRFQPDARVLVMPAPVRPVFYQAPSQDAARDALGIPRGERCVLLMSGAWGLGPVAAAARALGDAGIHVLAVAGRNPRLEHRLAEVAHPDFRADLRKAADELAAQGHFVEAMHVLLLQALADIRRRLREEFADSMTSREILRSKHLSDDLRGPLREVVNRVEVTYFGEQPAAIEPRRSLGNRVGSCCIHLLDRIQFRSKSPRI